MKKLVLIFGLICIKCTSSFSSPFDSSYFPLINGRILTYKMGEYCVERKINSIGKSNYFELANKYFFGDSVLSIHIDTLYHVGTSVYMCNMHDIDELYVPGEIEIGKTYYTFGKKYRIVGYLEFVKIYRKKYYDIMICESTSFGITTKYYFSKGLGLVRVDYSNQNSELMIKWQ